MTRIGVFGGQFDPPHDGHVAVAQAAVSGLGLDRLLVVVDADPPHRPPSERPAEVRGRMAELAFAGIPEAEVRVLSPDDPRFTVETLRGLSADGELFLILGADQLAHLGSWHDAQGVRALATLVVAPRSDIDARDPDAVVLGMEPVDLSSTEIRAELARGIDLSGQIPADVLGLIQREKVYR